MLRLLHVVTTTGSMICAWDMFCYLYGDHVSYIVCMRSCANGFNPVALCLSINFIYLPFILGVLTQCWISRTAFNNIIIANKNSEDMKVN